MTAAALRVLCIPAAPADMAASPYGPFITQDCATFEVAARELREGPAPDAILFRAEDAALLGDWPALSQAVLESALVVAAPATPDDAVAMLQIGVQDVLDSQDGATLGRALRLAVERKRIERAARKAYATDLATGLPNHTQLLEHMSHLLALREREPAPMALIALRIEGLARTAELLGPESANVLRRKAAVRLRSALRASDVVASVGTDTFAVLLAWIDSPQDGERVRAKLAQVIALGYTVAGREQKLAVSAGLASYPEHGKDADALLRRALGQAAQHSTPGTVFGGLGADRGPDAAANDPL